MSGPELVVKMVTPAQDFEQGRGDMTYGKGDMTHGKGDMTHDRVT